MATGSCHGVLASAGGACEEEVAGTSTEPRDGRREVPTLSAEHVLQPFLMFHSIHPPVHQSTHPHGTHSPTHPRSIHPSTHFPLIITIRTIIVVDVY